MYERKGQRVWAVDEDEQIVRSWLVTGSKYGNEQPGVHEVYSRSEQSTAWNGQAKLPLMIRYQKTDIGAIGFHGIPIHVSDGSAYQTEAELGTRLSVAASARRTPTPRSCGRSPRSARRSSSSDRCRSRLRARERRRRVHTAGTLPSHRLATIGACTPTPRSSWLRLRTPASTVRSSALLRRPARRDPLVRPTRRRLPKPSLSLSVASSPTRARAAARRRPRR